jgi:hypothetical protein
MLIVFAPFVPVNVLKVFNPIAERVWPPVFAAAYVTTGSGATLVQYSWLSVPIMSAGKYLKVASHEKPVMGAGEVLVTTQ